MEGQELRCEHCGQSFGSAVDLDKHNKQMHPGLSDAPGGDSSRRMTISGEENEENQDDAKEE